MHTCKQFPHYRSQTTWKCADLNRPHIPPITCSNPAIYGPCKAGHENRCIWRSPLIKEEIAATNKKRKEQKLFWHWNEGSRWRSGGSKGNFVWWPQQRSHKYKKTPLCWCAVCKCNRNKLEVFRLDLCQDIVFFFFFFYLFICQWLWVLFLS